MTRSVLSTGVGNAATLPWWAPPEPLDTRARRVLIVLALASLPVGYLNTLLTQTITFAADEFQASDTAQGFSLAAVRGGVLIALVVVGLADRHGRRLVALISLATAPVVSALGAIAPNLVALTATQIVGRPLAISLGLVIVIIAIEEMPKGSRAYAVSLLSISTAVGAGACLVVLPLSDLGVRGWRLVYVAPLVFLILVPVIARHLPESRRYEAPHPDATFKGHGRRFWLLAVSGLLTNLLVAPASGFQNRYLKKVRGFSARRVALFSLVTNTPGGLGVVVGGRLADNHGRRTVAAVGLVGGSLATVLVFSVGGAWMWAWSTVGALVGALAVPALGVYAAELFPTGLRGRANAAITVLSLAGSAVGLVLAGAKVHDTGGYGPVMAVLAIGPLLVAILVLALYPETARVELEDINPEDRVEGAPAT